MAGRQCVERLAVDLRTGDGRDLTWRDGPEGRRAPTSFERGALADDRTRTQFGDDCSVDVHGQHTVEQKKQFIALCALLDERSTFLHLTNIGLLAPAHDRVGQLTFERGLDFGDERRRVEVTPWCVLAERALPPVLELCGAALLRETTVL